MSNRPNQLSVYVTNERKAEIEQRANEENTTISRLVNEMIDRYLQQEARRFFEERWISRFLVTMITEIISENFSID